MTPSASSGTPLPLLIRDGQYFRGLTAGRASSHRILGCRPENRPVVSAEADVTSDQSQQQQEMQHLPQIGAGRSIDFRTSAMRTIP